MKIAGMAALSRGAELAPFHYDTPPLAPYECIVKISHCGICHSDIHMIDDDWHLSRYPFVPGHEIVGEVVEVGAALSHLAHGDRVGVGWQRAACLACVACLSGNENLCSRQEGTITHGHGGFADHLRIDGRFCFRLPAGLESANAGPLLCGGVTVYAALAHAGLRPGMAVGVIGVGGLGHLAVQFAAKLGSEVTAFTTSRDKADFAERLGARRALVSSGPSPGGKPERPLDIIVSTPPVDLDWSAYVDLLGPDGTLVFVGVPPKPIDIHAGRLLSHRRRVMASPIGGRGITLEALAIADRLAIRPVVEVFPLGEANAALRRVRTNQVRYRAVLAV